IGNGINDLPHPEERPSGRVSKDAPCFPGPNSSLRLERATEMTAAPARPAAPLADIPSAIGIEDGNEMLCLAWPDGRRDRFPAIWLADNRPEARKGEDGQRLTDALDLPDEVTLRRAAIDGTEIEIAFSCFPEPSRFDAAWLRRHAPGPAARAARERQ